MTTPPDKTGDKGPERIYAHSAVHISSDSWNMIRGTWQDKFSPVISYSYTDIVEYVRSDLYDALQSANAELVKERDRYRDLLAIVLPMAKGYALANNVGNNWGKCREAEEALSHTTNKAEGG